MTEKRDLLIEECARAAHEAAGQFMSNSDRYVMQGPSGLVRSMLAAIRALKSSEPVADVAAEEQVRASARASPSSIEQILRTASPQVRAICLSLLRQLAKAKEKK